MRQRLLLWISVLTLFTSCAQAGHSAQSADTSDLVHPDTVQVLGKNIMTIFQDSRGEYWFASWEDGLYNYDGKTLLHFTTKCGLPHNRVEEIQEDQNGLLYFNTRGGLCKYNGQQFVQIIAEESEAWSLLPGDLWFKGLQYEDKVLRYDGTNLYALPFPKSELGEEWQSDHPSPISPYIVYTIYKDSHGNIWFGTAALGACRFNGISFDWISEEDVHELHFGPSNGVRSIVEDKDGYFWFNSAYRYDVYNSVKPNGESFYRREKSIGNIDGNPDSNFWEYLSIAKDNSNDLWIATYLNGVWRYDGRTTTHYSVQSEGKDITLFSVYKDHAGGLWLGTHEHGAYRFNGTGFEPFAP